MCALSTVPATTAHRVIRQLAQIDAFTHLTSHNSVKEHNSEGFEIDRYHAYTRALAWKILSAVGDAVERLVHLPEDQVDKIGDFQNMSTKSIVAILAVRNIQIPPRHESKEAFAQELSEGIVLMVRKCRHLLSALDEGKLADLTERESQLQSVLTPTAEAGSHIRLLMDSICSTFEADGSQGVGMLARLVRDMQIEAGGDESVSPTWSIDSNFAWYGNADMFGMLIPMIQAYQQAVISYASLTDEHILSLEPDLEPQQAAEIYELATGYARGIYQLTHSEDWEPSADDVRVKDIVDLARESTKWASESGEVNVEVEEAASNEDDDY